MGRSRVAQHLHRRVRYRCASGNRARRVYGPRKPIEHPDADAHTYTDLHTCTDPQSNADADTSTDPQCDADANPASQSDTDSDADSDADTNSDADADADADSNSDTNPDADTDSDAIGYTYPDACSFCVCIRSASGHHRLYVLRTKDRAIERKVPISIHTKLKC